MKGLTRIVMLSMFSLFSSCKNQPAIRDDPVPPEIVKSFAEARKICDKPYTYERRRVEETAKEFGARFCSKFGVGHYVNPCHDGDFYYISCFEKEGIRHCAVLIDGEPCNQITDYCGRCD